MGSTSITRALLVALACGAVTSLTPLSAAGDDNDCALYLSGPGRTSAYDYSLNLLKGNFGYEGQHTCITYDAVNQAYLEARNRIVVAQPKGDWKAEDFASVGELVLDISINLARRYGLTYEEIEKGLPLIDTSRTLIRDVCPPVFSHVECRAGKYRRFDGLCNNLQHPTWGSTMAPFQRLLGPLFSDGINAPRIAHTGRDLPLSRVVSRTMHPDDGFHDHAGTVMVIAWGQFMDHDYTLTGTPLDPINRNDPEECCKRPPHLKHPYCNEIRIPDDDYFYRLWNVKCIDFVRAFPSPRPGCRLGSRVPFNTLTGSIDGNTVYGVTEKFSRKLRTGFGGLLRMNPVFKEYGLKDLLPLKLDIPDEGCTRPNANMYCFEAGEIRVNEQLVLTVMHTLMAREHNRVAKALAHVNPHWDDETLFQEARRINIAEIQHITYNEFLPILLGKDVMEKFGLVLEKEGYWEGYDPHVNPDVIDAFASAAFRFGHSLLPTAVERWSKAHKFIASKRLSDLIRRPFDLYRAGVLDEYVMGLMNQVAQAMDDSITQEVTNHLFKKVGARFGMDLVSFNMQRGREFGIPGYMEFRKFCGLHGADSFQDLFGAMPNETVRKYETIFEHPIDVDLWSGGVSERPLPGSMLGPTFACVIATQFSYSRRGDRFWFELPNQPSSFTPEQLAEIRKSRLARVICDNTDIIDTVQLYPMVLPDHELNPRVPCRSGIIPSMDFSKWAESVPFHGAKPFVTEANATRNVTETDEQLNITAENSSTNDNSNAKNVETDDNEEGKTNAQITNCIDGKNLNCTDSNINCTNCTKLKETQGPDTILKYVYKNSNEVSSKKSSGHLKNSLRRKKRSTGEGLRYAASAPVIVNYKTNHSPYYHHGPYFQRQTGNKINNADLADFNIETLHDSKLHNKVDRLRKYNERDDVSASKEDEKSDKRTETRNGNQKHDESSDERSNHDTHRNHSSETDSDNRDIDNERYQKRNENSEERSQEHDNERSREDNDSREQDEPYDKKNDSYEDRQQVPYSRRLKNEEEHARQQVSYSRRPKNEEEYARQQVPYSRRQESEEERAPQRVPYSRRQESEEKHARQPVPYSRRQENEEKHARQPVPYSKQQESEEEHPRQQVPYSRRQESEEEHDIRNDETDRNPVSYERSDVNSASKTRDSYRTNNINSHNNDDTHNVLSREQSGEKSKYIDRESSDSDSREETKKRGRDSNDSQEDLHQEIKSKYTDSSNDSNEGGELSEDTNNPRYDKSYERSEEEKSAYSKPSSGSAEHTGHKQVPYENKDHLNHNIDKYHKNNIPSLNTPPKESEEEEAIIAIMKKKNHDVPLEGKNDRLAKIRDVDLDDFSNYERIHVSSKGIVEPVPDTHENYDSLSVPLIPPLTTSQPNIIHDHDKQYARSTHTVNNPTSVESNEDHKELVHINDEEVKPVVELLPDHPLSSDENSKEEIKSNDDEDTSLETLLGVKFSSGEKSEKVVHPEKQENGDVKQQFERIPLNYNHATKEQEQSDDKPNDTGTNTNDPETENDRDQYNSNHDIAEEVTPLKPVKYDENLNIKFDDLTIRLPDIKLPEDILAVPYEEPFYVKNEKQKINKPEKENFFVYGDPDYNIEERPYGSKYTAAEDEEHTNHDEPAYYGRYQNDNKKEDQRKNKDYDDEEDERDVDLYEKFVREKFGKSGTFKKRSEKLTEPTLPVQENEKLFQALNLVLKKASNIEKEAQKSGDPKAGYMWTVEYGQPL